MKNSLFKQVKQAVKNWWLILIIGIIFVAAAIWTFTSPSESYLALSLLFGISFFVSGLLGSIFAISNSKILDNWGWILVFGILNILLGVYLMSNPEIAESVFPFFVGFMILFNSIWAMGFALDLKSYKVMEWGTLMVFAVLGVIFSFVMILNPYFAGMTIVIWTGIGLLMIGIFNILLSFRLQKIHKKWNDLSSEFKTKYDEIQQSIENEIDKIKDIVNKPEKS